MRGGGRQLCQQRLIGDDKHLLCVLFWLSTSVTPDSVPWLDELPSPVLATLNLAESKFGLFLDNNEQTVLEETTEPQACKLKQV